MKKTIVGLVILVGLVGGCSTSKLEVETKQRMPIPDGRFYLRSQTWYFGGKAGVGDLYDRDGDGKWDIVFNYLKCNKERQRIPYGVYDKFTRTLTLDNNPTDGFVDDEISNIGLRPVDKDAQNCP